ncbi:MAG: hypothetical protein H7Z40_21910 [Phycisphaerae bacterium]|nr:hypothetical protein [Gemmatimonadaceae bacterium]
MNIWDKVKDGIDKAGKAAQDVFDDGKTRIEAYRAREQADKAAESLGYAVFRALELGKEMEPESRDRLMTSLRERDAEARRLETLLTEETVAKPDAPPPPPPPPSAGSPADVPPPPPPPAAAGATPEPGFPGQV